MVTAIILIHAERHRINTLAEELVEREEISEVYSVSGDYDLVAIVRVQANADLAQLVTEELSGVEGILKTHTMLAFNAYSRHDLEQMFALGT